MEFRVDTPERQQFVVSAGLDKLAAAQHINRVNVANRGQAMRDRNRGSVLHQSMDATLNQSLSF